MFACDKVCCANYKPVRGKCIECPKGTYRIDGPHCTKCLDGFFGYFCSSSCPDKCNKCHPVDGSCCYDNGNDCLSSDKNVDKSKDIIQLLLVFGLPCVVSVLLIISVGCFIKRKCMCSINWRIHRQADTTNIQDLNDGYDMIDENSIAVNDHPTQRSHQPIFVISEQSDDNIIRNSDNYLQPIPVKDLILHGSDDSVGTNIPVCNSTEYLHPYNSLRPDWRNHTHVYNDEELELQSDGYLNPYQPLQENWLQKNHVYDITEKQICAHGNLGGEIHPEPLGQEPQMESKM